MNLATMALLVYMSVTFSQPIPEKISEFVDTYGENELTRTLSMEGTE